MYSYFYIFRKNALMIDEWEVDGDLVSLEDELGEGAFGKVYKGTLREINTPSRKLSMMPPVNALRKGTLNQSTGLTVAVKMLHGEFGLLKGLDASVNGVTPF